MNGMIFYGLHMVKGVAEYPEKEAASGEAYRVLISENTAKQMDTTFPGKPMYVEHVAEVVTKDIKKESVGYVVESFFNKPDGNHWCKFIVTDQAGLTAIQQGYVLSNCYIGKGFGPSGEWHAVPYAKEVTTAEYEHLAITQKPRYKESVILTPEEFKKYNEEKEAELVRLSNSIQKTKNDNPKKQETRPMKFNFFKKEKMENSADLEQMSVMLPKSKKEVTIERLINSMDEAEMNSSEPKLANGDDKVKVGDQEMTVNELSEKYNSMCKAKNSEDEEKKKNSEAEEAKKKKEEEEKAKNAAADPEKEKNSDEAKKKEEEEKAKNAEEEKKKSDEKAQNSAHFERLANAHAKVASAPATDFSWDQAARGKSKYGSTKK